jgi:hypothetical protein
MQGDVPAQLLPVKPKVPTVVNVTEQRFTGECEHIITTTAYFPSGFILALPSKQARRPGDYTQTNSGTDGYGMVYR